MTAPYYGKREPGLLTAASPGDTLYFNFGSYNDSGDSEAMSGLAVSDIEVFKNGIATTRATDSGYSLISDTGQVGDRSGLYRFSVQLFNTSDDTGHYESGAWYQVAVDAVTVDAKTVRFWAGSFEIGRQKVNVVEIDGDTGPADNLGRIAGDTGTNSYIPREVWAQTSRTLTAFAFDTGVWGSNAARTLTAFQFDTGVWGSNFASGRTLTSFLFDTGIAQTVWRSSTSGFTADTGSVGYAQGRIMAIRNDTGAAHLDQGRFGVLSDSGVAAAVLDTGKVAAAVWTSHATRTLTAFALDTGIAQTVWRSSTSTFTSDTGSVAYAQGRVMAVRTDTGAAHLDQGRFGVLSDSGVAAAVLDTGKVAGAVWTSHATRTLTAFALDTGVRDAIWRASPSSYTVDTGSFGYAAGRLMAVKGDTGAAHLDQGRLGVIADSGVLAAVLDTGKVASAVWTSHATRTLTAFALDTGVAQTVWRESQSTYADTGSLAYAQGRLMKVNADTGAAHLLNGRLGVDLTNFIFDTGVADSTWKYADTGSRRVNTNSLSGDTGAAKHLAQAFAALATLEDTGVTAATAAIKTKTDSLTFTTAGQVDANIQSVNDVTVTGTGAGGNEWRPV